MRRRRPRATRAPSRSRSADATFPIARPNVIDAGLTAQHPAGWFGALKARHFGAAPLTEDNSAKSPAYTTVDLQAGYRASGKWLLAVDVFNLFDAKWNDIEYYYVSRLQHEAAPAPDFVVHPGCAPHGAHPHPVLAVSARRRRCYSRKPPSCPDQSDVSHTAVGPHSLHTPRLRGASRALCICALALLFTYPGRPALGEPACKIGLWAELPVTMSGTSPIVHALINGRDAPFIADSGAFFNTLTPAAAAEYQLKLKMAPGWYVTCPGSAGIPRRTWRR